MVKSGEANKIKEADKVVLAFFAALKSHEFDRARIYAAIETKPILEFLREENEKYKEDQFSQPEVTVEIVDKEFEDQTGVYDLKIRAGDKSREAQIKVVLYENEWLVVVNEEQLTVLRSVVFRNQYEQIISHHINKPGKTMEIGSKRVQAGMAEEEDYHSGQLDKHQGEEE